MEFFNFWQVGFDQIRMIVRALEVLGEFGHVVHLDVIFGSVHNTATWPPPTIIICSPTNNQQR
jgi:hypothetical protein